MNLIGIVSEEFKRHGLPPTDNKFTAHVTLFKLSAQKRWGKDQQNVKTWSYILSCARKTH